MYAFSHLSLSPSSHQYTHVYCLETHWHEPFLLAGWTASLLRELWNTDRGLPLIEVTETLAFFTIHKKILFIIFQTKWNCICQTSGKYNPRPPELVNNRSEKCSVFVCPDSRPVPSRAPWLVGDRRDWMRLIPGEKKIHHSASAANAFQMLCPWDAGSPPCAFPPAGNSLTKGILE